MSEDNKTCGMDYESGYHRMCELNHKLECEFQELKYKHDAMESEFARMRAQLDIVYLIFGKQ